MKPPSPLKFMEAINGIQKAAVARAAVELDVFTLVARGHETVESLATATGCAPRGIRVLMDALTVLEMLEKQNGAYRLTPDSAVFLNRDSPEFMADSILFTHSDFVQRAFQSFTEAVRLGGAAVEAEGTVSDSHPVWIQYARGMMALARPQARKVVELAPAANRILDIATGHGLFGILLLQAHPQATCLAVDWENVLPNAVENARAAGVEDRFQTLAGSAFEVELGTGYDTVLLPNFLHHFQPAACVRLLRRLADAMVPGGRLFVIAPIPNDDRVSPSAPAWFATMMLATTPSGDAYTTSEYAGLLREAGFLEPEFHSVTGSARSVLVSTKPG
ncbi:MAG: methyltransferase domain-containing protein [Acidobacteria bacterium]|nr:methyltransferase domain-containing protein [Acidobacteriota bacterium]